MKSRRSLLYVFISFLFPITLFYSCQKDKLNISITDISLDDSYDFRYIVSDSSDHLIAIGGKTWHIGVFAESFDNGGTWISDSISSNILMDGCFDSNGDFLCTGFSGLMNRNTNYFWMSSDVNPWHRLLGIDFRKDLTIIVGGEGYKSGSIYILDSIQSVSKLVDLRFELSTVKFFSDDVAFIGGYGQILRISNYGTQIDSFDISGDNFVNFTFPTDDIGYCIGSRGTIIKTNDGGLTWDKIRNPNNLTVSHKSFNAIESISQNEIIIVGDNGLCWYSNDYGNSWQEIEGIPDFNIFDIISVDREIFLIGEKGNAYKFKI